MRLFEKQIFHFIALAFLLFGLSRIVREEGFLTGEFWRISTKTWFWIAVALPVLHQVYVWLVWRMQLHYSLITRYLGKHAFVYYAIGFAILFASRFIFILFLGISNENTFNGHPVLIYGLAFVLLLPAFWLFYSVKKYFDFRRAFGIDHFDSSFRELPLVRGGIFKYTKNGMYTFGFFLFWVIALLFQSRAALLVALFNHLYIWVHYYCTELPDMKRIYGRH